MSLPTTVIQNSQISVPAVQSSSRWPCKTAQRKRQKRHQRQQREYHLPSHCAFTVQMDTEMVRGEVKRSTRIICYLKEDQSEFLAEAY